MSGLELEEAETIGASLDGVVVGHVLSAEQHPNADRLTLCQVDLGNGEPVQIVCGAPNVAAGQKAPVARVGTTLMLPSRDKPGEKVAIKLKKAKIRGEVSMGMICAEDELGLSDDHTGIMVLDDDAPIGQPFDAFLQSQGIITQDTALDLAITPNRPDAISHLGVARDVAALTEVALKRPEVTVPTAGGAVAEEVTVKIECPEACHRYVALLVRGITIKESPDWLKKRLTAIGLRPINNIVDITNYVMYECGQPLHAFDFDQLAGATIIVRQATGGEKFTTLDSKEHMLPAGTVLICDAERPVALGGMMGGENSEVSDTTTNVLIESAYFDPSITRKAAKTLGLSTDASYRFERGVDADGQAWAAARAAELMVALGEGELVSGMVDAHPTKPQQPVLPLRLSRIAAIMGIDIPRDEVIRILTVLGFGVAESEGETLHCTVPTYRPDVEREIDLIEEVARIYGFDNIPEPAHTPLPHFSPRPRPADQIRQVTQAFLGGNGYRELYTNSLLSKEEAEHFNHPSLSTPTTTGPVVETLNPISQTMTTLRPSLLRGMLQVMGFNQNHGQEVLRFYEFGHVFHKTDREDVLVPGYAEHEAFIMALSGPDAPDSWDHKTRPVDFFDLKGDVEVLLETLRLPNITMTPSYDATPLTAYHLTVASGRTPLGIIARISDALAETLDLKTPVYYSEFDWSTVVTLATPQLARSYAAISRYPVVDRDIAIAVERSQPVGPMIETIEKAGRPLLRTVHVFDLYEGKGIAADKKSVAFSLRFGADRTLKDAEVDKRIAKIVAQLSTEYQAELRQ